MKNITETQVMGIKCAAEAKGWSAGKFAAYYYSNRTPPHKIMFNKPVWEIDDLKKWEPIKRSFKNTKKEKPHES